LVSDGGRVGEGGRVGDGGCVAPGVALVVAEESFWQAANNPVNDPSAPSARNSRRFISPTHVPDVSRAETSSVFSVDIIYIHTLLYVCFAFKADITILYGEGQAIFLVLNILMHLSSISSLALSLEICRTKLLVPFAWREGDESCMMKDRSILQILFMELKREMRENESDHL
jgi:hypothetical protein